MEGLSEVPVSKSLDPNLDPEDPTTVQYREKLSLAQQAVGELLWLSTHSRTEICYGISVAGSLLHCNPSEDLVRCHMIVRYLRRFPASCLKYGPAPCNHGPDDHWPVLREQTVLESFADSSLAPTCHRLDFLQAASRSIVDSGERAHCFC